MEGRVCQILPAASRANDDAAAKTLPYTKEWSDVAVASARWEGRQAPWALSMEYDRESAIYSILQHLPW